MCLVKSKISSIWPFTESLATYFFKDIFKFIFETEGKGGRKRGRETSMCGGLLCAPSGDLAPNPGMCPDWELNQQLFGLQASTQSTEPHQPGHYFFTEIYGFFESLYFS